MIHMQRDVLTVLDSFVYSNNILFDCGMLAESLMLAPTPQKLQKQLSTYALHRCRHHHERCLKSHLKLAHIYLNLDIYI